MLKLIMVMGVVFGLSSLAHADQVSAINAARSLSGVIDAVVDTTGNLYLSVKSNNALEMKQLANYACRLVIPHQGRIFRVRIVNIISVIPSKAPGSWSRLAEARCDGSG